MAAAGTGSPHRVPAVQGQGTLGTPRIVTVLQWGRGTAAQDTQGGTWGLCPPGWLEGRSTSPPGTPGTVGPVPAHLPWVRSSCSPHPRAAESILEMGNGSVSPWKRGHQLAMPRGHTEPRGHELRAAPGTPGAPPRSPSPALALAPGGHGRVVPRDVTGGMSPWPGAAEPALPGAAACRCASSRL